MKQLCYFIMVITVLASLICCVTETGPSNGPSPVEPVSTTSTTVYSISHVEFDSLSYILTAETDASDDQEIIVTVNNQSVIAKASKGRLSADLSKCWTNANKGGKQYEVTFSAANAGVNPSNVNIDYWPKAVCELKCASEIAVYNGSTKAYQSPQFTLNYEADTYDYTMSFIVKNTLDNDITRTVPGIANWKLNDMVTYLMNTERFGYSVKVTATVTPKRNGILQTDLQCEVHVTYISCKDVLATKVRIEHYYNYYIAVPYDKDDKPAGGDIKYEWQVSENKQNWLSMLDNGSVLEITKDNLGKYLRCIITQTYEGKVQTSITSEAIKLNNLISEAYLYYNEIVHYGNNPIAELITGTAVDVFGYDIKGLTFSLENPSTGMKSSDYVSVKVSKDGFEDYIGSIFVNVQNTITDEDVIPLSTDVYHITTDKVKFTKSSDILEYSLDDGATWNVVTTDEFSAAVGDTILVRKKGAGVSNNPGYVKPSEAKSLKVTADNVGVPVYSIERVQFNSQTFILTADTDAPNGIVFTATINNRSVSAKSNQGKLTFDTTQCWTKSHKGGKSYPIVIGVDEQGKIGGYVESSIEYWPKAECELKCPEQITVWNGKTDTYQAPNFIVNYEDETYQKKFSFVVKNETANITSTVGAANWNLNDMLIYLCNTDHNGHSVEVTITLTPKPNDTLDTSLKCETKVTYYCLREKLVSRIQVLKYYDYYLVGAYDANDEPAGGVIQYEWQVSDNQNDWITTNDNQSVHRMSKNEIGKYLRCVITQTFEGNEKDPITSGAVLMTNVFIASDLRYNGVVQVRDNPVLENISGTVLDIFGDIVDGLTFSWTNLSDGMMSSDEMTVTISKENFEDCTDCVFVNVQNVLSDKDVILLSTDVQNIPANKVQFTDTSSDIECSFDNGTTWKAIPEDAFDAAIGDVILLRKKEIGTINQKGYIMASEPKSQIVSEANIGLPIYAVNAQAKFDATKDEIEVSIDAPDGVLFTVSMNNHLVDVHSYQRKLKLDVSSFLSENDVCGKDYTIDVSADNAIISPSQAKVSYWPKAKVTLDSEQFVVIWTGDERYLVPDPAYTLNYPDCDIEINYEVKSFADNDGTTPDVNTSSWTIDDMIDYIFDNEHTGEVVEIHFRAIPKKNGTQLTNLAIEWDMTYDHRYDEPIKSAEIKKKYNNNINSYYFAITAYNSTESEAGGTLDYVWEIADSADGTFSAVTDNPTGMIHLLKQDEIGKYLRCTITQTYQGDEQSPVATAPVRINSVIKSATVSYGAIVPEGVVPNKSDLSGDAVSIYDDNVSLTADDMEFTGEVNKVSYISGGSQYSVSVPDYLTNGLSYSMNVPVKITKDGYDTTYDTVFVTVQSVMTEQPSLVTDVWTVTSGKVKFDGDYLALEYKLNDAAEWKTVTSKEFVAQTDDKVHIRKKSSGVEGKHGYVKESAEITLTVTENNIGKRAETEQGMEVEITNVSLKLTQTLDGNRIKVTAALENTSGIEYFGSLSYVYTWRVDGFIADNLNYAEVNNNVLYLDQSQMASGETYQVSAFVEIHYRTTIPKNDIVLMKEQKQLSVTVQ